MLSLLVHYKNKYPGAKVIASEDALDVHLKDGSHAVALRKNGAGQWVDMSEQLGCNDRHDLAPIPKDARVFKVRDGKISDDELAGERREMQKQFLCDKGQKVLSCADLKAKGWKFSDRQELVEAGAAAKAESKAE